MTAGSLLNRGDIMEVQGSVEIENHIISKIYNAPLHKRPWVHYIVRNVHGRSYNNVKNTALMHNVQPTDYILPVPLTPPTKMT